MGTVLKNPEQRFAWLATALSVTSGLAGLLLFYWATIDREAPYSQVQGKYVGLDATETNVGWVEMTGYRNRACPGIVYTWLIDGVVAEMPPVPIGHDGPDEDFGDRQMRWWQSFKVPRGFDRMGVVRIRILWHCNPVQRLLPLVTSPEDIPFNLDIEVKK